MMRYIEKLGDYQEALHAASLIAIALLAFTAPFWVTVGIVLVMQVWCGQPEF